MENVINQLLPFIKGYLMLYIIAFIITIVFIIAIFVIVSGLIIKENRDFNKNWSKHRKRSENK